MLLVALVSCFPHRKSAVFDTYSVYVLNIWKEREMLKSPDASSLIDLALLHKLRTERAIDKFYNPGKSV